MNDLMNTILGMATQATPLEALGDNPPIDKTGLFDSQGVMVPQPASFYAGLTVAQRAQLGHDHGIYSFPTTEGVSFIAAAIAGRNFQALEIGAGNGGWCRALNIRGTDSYLQRRPDIAAKYASIRQPTASYGAHVEKLEAIKAVRKYRPKIVVASWVTQKFRADRFCMRGNADGVDELRLLELVDEYIMVGNTAQHGDKMILEDIAKGVSTHEVAGAMFENVASRAVHGEDFIIWLRRKH
ncbi:hypothetical protein GJ904_20050 [Salmonella enterica]|nr:hypothetical protein [Salmonella enterica subsp. enterica serovar Saintpaul]EEC1303358.1 hypothetical protein [Salmonella enterica]